MWMILVRGFIQNLILSLWLGLREFGRDFGTVTPAHDQNV